MKGLLLGVILLVAGCGSTEPGKCECSRDQFQSYTTSGVMRPEDIHACSEACRANASNGTSYTVQKKTCEDVCVYLRDKISTPECMALCID